MAPIPASTTAPVATRIGRRSALPPRLATIPALTRVLLKAAMTTAVAAWAGVVGSGELGHRQGDRVDVGEPGQRCQDVDAAAGEVDLDHLDQQQHGREQDGELGGRGQAERVSQRHVAGSEGGSPARAGPVEEPGQATRDQAHRRRTGGSERPAAAPGLTDQDHDQDAGEHHRPGEQDAAGEGGRRVGSSRLRRAKESVTAVEETRPPVMPVSAVPRPAPSQRVAT